MKFSVELQKRGFCVGYPRRFNLRRCDLAMEILFDMAGAKEVEMDPASLTCGAFGVFFEEDPRSNEELIEAIHAALALACSAPMAIVKLAEWINDATNKSEYAYNKEHKRMFRSKKQEFSDWLDLNSPAGVEAQRRVKYKLPRAQAIG